VIRKLVIPAELGEGIEVRLLQWFKTQGDPVAVGQALLEFETDKALVLVTAMQAGALRRCFYEPGDWMKPGDIVAWLSDSADERLPLEGEVPSDTLMVTFDTT